MKHIVSYKTAVRGNLILFGVFIVFHLSVIAGFISSGIVWGGRITSRSELIRLETISIAVMLICMTVTTFKAKCIQSAKLKLVVNSGAWLMVVLFLLNTIGNIFAVTMFEKVFFTPITIALTVFSLRIALENKVPEE